MTIPIYCIEIVPENIKRLWACCQCLSDNMYRASFLPYSELWLLRADMLIAFRRYGNDYQRIAEYLRPGREDWGIGP